MRPLTLLLVAFACAGAAHAAGKAKTRDGKALERTYWDIVGGTGEGVSRRTQQHTANLLDLAKECKGFIGSGKGTPDVHLAYGRVLEDLAHFHEAAFHYGQAGDREGAKCGRARSLIGEAIANAARRGLGRRFVRDVVQLPGTTDRVVLQVRDDDRMELALVRRRGRAWKRIASELGHETGDWVMGKTPNWREDLSLRALGGGSGAVAVRTADVGASYTPSHVTVFRWTGKRFRRLWGSSSSWEVECRDLDRDGVDEIITSRTLGLWGNTPVKCHWNDFHRWNGRTIVEANARYPHEFRDTFDGLKGALVQDPNEPEILLHLGIICEMRREPGRALGVYRKAEGELRRKLRKLLQITDREYRTSLEHEYRSAQRQLQRRIARLSRKAAADGSSTSG